MHSVVSRFAFVLLIVCAASTALAGSPPLAVAVDASGVTISNVPVGGAVALFSCSRIPQPRSIDVVPQALVLHDDARLGSIRYAPKGGVPLRSVFVAVDEASGQFATASSPGFPARFAPLAPEVFRKDADQLIASVVFDRPHLFVLLVRPGSGAWQLFNWDGGPHDRDGHADGRQELAFEDAMTLDGKDKAPKNLKADDVVVLIDPGHLDVFTARVDK